MTLNRLLTIGLALVTASLPLSAKAGDYYSGKDVFDKEPLALDDPFADTIRPISNPTLFDSPIPRNYIHGIYIHNDFPGFIDTVAGNVPIDGEFEVYAVGLELALTDRLAINATKDGYIFVSPDSTLTRAEGFANVAAGIKYAWLINPEKEVASAINLNYEIPLGHTEVFQGEGDGVIIPSVSTLKNFGNLQLINQTGFKLPIDTDSESSKFYTSFHASFPLTDWFHPIFEVNYFRVLNAGDGSPRFGEQAGGAVPSLPTFEAGDLLNFGGANSEINPDFVSAALGFRIVNPKASKTSVGFAWETPLTPIEESIMHNRFTIDFTVQF
ncbi:MAG: hypothetical protein AAF357_17390 [Verrucomicrobiota bacterium]